MKKTALLLVIVLALSSVLTSCKFFNSLFEPESFEELWERIDEKMEDIHSYRIDTEANMEFESEGVKISGNIDMQSVVIGTPDDEDFYLYNASESVTRVSGTVQQEIKSVLAYSDGKMYVGNTENEKTSKIFSEMSRGDFFDYYEDNSSDIDFSPECINEKKMNKNEDGTWELSLSSFDKEYLNELLDDLGFTANNLGITIDDIAISMKADSKFRAMSITLDFKMDKMEEPVIAMTMRYSDYDCAQRVEIEEEKYKEVADARIVGWIDTYLNEAIDDSDGSFTLILEQKLNKTNTVYKETDKATYSSGGTLGFHYDIDADINGQKVGIEYSLGNQTISVGGQTQKIEQSEREARAFISSLINQSNFNPAHVFEVKKIEDGKYRIDLVSTQITEYKQIMASINDTYTGYTFYIVVDMDGEDVKSIETNITIDGKFNVYSIVSTVTFD